MRAEVEIRARISEQLRILKTAGNWMTQEILRAEVDTLTWVLSDAPGRTAEDGKEEAA